ncbi:MAG: Na+/H+ antiporter NhaC [Planctomycetes bacterium]|nr:Na+/H+ antiporter NhaC [Planctomycetota bacterium]
MTTPTKYSVPRQPLGLAVLPVLALVGLLYVNVQVFASSDNQIPLVFATAFAAAVAVWFGGCTWEQLEKGIVQSIGTALQASLILLVVGMLIAAWVQAGVVPQLIVYGLELITPGAFLVTACLVCCVVSLATGSSWTTAGTVGVALIGVGGALGLDLAMVAGAVVSGSYFGDKMSPLSDTTNLAPAMAGATLVEHVRHMVYTVTPALAISLALYAFLGGSAHGGDAALDRVAAVIATLESHFTLTPWLLAPPLAVLGLIAARAPALPALLGGTLLAVVIGLATQPAGFTLAALASYVGGLYGGFSIDLLSAVPVGAEYDVQRAAAETVQSLLDGRGGMKSMLGTIALIFCAMSFGGVMERSGMLEAIAKGLLRVVRGTGSLVAATIVSCLGVNVLAADQYMAIVVPGRMFRRAFLERRLHVKNLSRALEDSGTVTSALIPWNTCGAQMTIVLGVATGLYWKYAFLNLLCPIVSIVYGFTGITMTRITDAEARAQLGEDEPPPKS